MWLDEPHDWQSSPRLHCPLFQCLQTILLLSFKGWSSCMQFFMCVFNSFSLSIIILELEHTNLFPCWHFFLCLKMSVFIAFLVRNVLLQLGHSWAPSFILSMHSSVCLTRAAPMGNTSSQRRHSPCLCFACMCCYKAFFFGKFLSQVNITLGSSLSYQQIHQFHLVPSGLWLGHLSP